MYQVTNNLCLYIFTETIYTFESLHFPPCLWHFSYCLPSQCLCPMPTTPMPVAFPQMHVPMSVPFSRIPVPILVAFSPLPGPMTSILRCLWYFPAMLAKTCPFFFLSNFLGFGLPASKELIRPRLLTPAAGGIRFIIHGCRVNKHLCNRQLGR